MPEDREIVSYIFYPRKWWADDFSLTLALREEGFDLDRAVNITQGESGAVIFYQDKEDSDDTETGRS